MLKLSGAVILLGIQANDAFLGRLLKVLTVVITCYNPISIDFGPHATLWFLTNTGCVVAES